MATTTYHCPSCSAPIEYKPEKQLFSCDYCLSQYTPEQMEEHFKQQQAKDQERAERALEREEQKRARDPEDTTLNEYSCQNCGAHVVTDETTSATFCFYCHSPVIITTRLQGEFKPDQILPFAISEEDAKQGFLDWAKIKKYLPPDFTSQAQLEKMTGIYIPYWYLDSDVDVDFQGSSNSVRRWRSGNYQYTETTVYEHIRQGTYHLTDVNLAAFSKIDENLLHGIEPFEPEGLQPFSMPLLSGFFAEQYTMSKTDAEPLFDKEIDNIANDLLNRSFGFTDGVKTSHKQMDRTDKDWLFSLMPVWVLTYQYNGETFVYSMNGQTGKAFGELPLVEGRLNRDSALRGLILGLIVAVVVFLIFWFLR